MTKMKRFARDKEKATIFAVAYGNFKDIENMKDLKREKLTLAEYNAVYDILKTTSDCKTSATTIMSNVKNWFVRNDFVVTENGIGWIISL